MTPPILSPPALHFLIIDFTITCGNNQLIFVATTDVACHLTLHLSHEEPIIRRIPYQKRGADFQLSSVTCFVEVDTIDQDEAGDTTTHTFTVPLVAYDHMHYWYSTGTQGGTPMISISQIFRAQCPVYVPPPVTVKLYSGYGWNKPSIDAWLQRATGNASWASIHNGVQTSCDCGYTNLRGGWLCGSRANRWKAIYRAKMTHDLSGIPVGSTIQIVKFCAVCYGKYAYGGLSMSAAIFILPTTTYTTCGSTDYQLCQNVPISNSFAYADLTVGQWYAFIIDPAYHYLFIPGQKSSICLREATYDAPNSQPPFSYYKAPYIAFHSIESYAPSTDPYLEITYQPP